MTMQKRTQIAKVLGSEKKDYQATVMGWVRTFRNNQFIALNDGSTLKTLQVVVDREKMDESMLKRIATGAAIAATGTVVESQGTNTFGAVFRLRHSIAFSIHKFFNDRGYFYIHSPIITGSDAEGAGEMFQVTTMNMENVEKDDDTSVYVWSYV